MVDFAPLSTYQRDFINFLVDAEVLSFGDFTTKSGRRTPYFVNTGRFNTGSRIAKLGAFYAAHIQKIGLADVDTIFGPAYKGIPLCVSTSLALFHEYQLDVGYTFNRKERKEHGDISELVGTPLEDGDSILIVEDVITAGITLRETVQNLRRVADIEIKGVIISVDRCERGNTQLSAAEEMESELGLSIYPIVTIHEVIEYLASPNSSGFTLSPELVRRMQKYLEEYGA